MRCAGGAIRYPARRSTLRDSHLADLRPSRSVSERRHIGDADVEQKTMIRTMCSGNAAACSAWAICTRPMQRPHSSHKVRHSQSRPLHATIRARHPLLPAGTRSLRSVSVILTSPPQQAKRARSGSLQLHSAQTEGGETYLNRTGGNPEPPRPRKITAPVPGFPQTPFLPPPELMVPATPMTVEGAIKTSAAVTVAGAKGAELRGPARIPARAGCGGKCRMLRTHMRYRRSLIPAISDLMISSALRPGPCVVGCQDRLAEPAVPPRSFSSLHVPPSS